jgi:hypothetical protein
VSGERRAAIGDRQAPSRERPAVSGEHPSLTVASAPRRSIY